MKKFYSIFTILIITSNVASSQDNIASSTDVKFSMFAGVNYAIPKGNDMDDEIDALDDMLDVYDDNGYDVEGAVQGRLGFHIGFNAEYAVNDDIAVFSSLSYSQKGFTGHYQVEGEEEQYNYNDGQFYTLDYFDMQKVKVELDYIDLPIGIRYNLNPQVSVFGGLLFSFLVKDNVESEYETEFETLNWDGGIVEASYSDTESDDFEDTFGEDPEEQLNGYQIGLGYSKDNYNISFKLNKNSNFGEMDYGDDNHNLTLQISTGIYF
jgi:hypothetical protein